MPLTLSEIPGFADLADLALTAESPSFGLLLQKMSLNAAFGMTRLEFFQGMYANGDTVPQPISGVDGYVFQRSELLYLWNPDLSTNKDSGWIQTGSGSLFFCNWFVDQGTGAVFSLEWYRNNGSGGSRTETNDGQIRVVTVGFRQRQNIIVATSPTYTALSTGDIATDKPWKEGLAQALNHDAKLACLNHEVFYCGEFTNGQTIARGVGSTLVSAADGYQYAYAECKFLPCYRWTTDGAALGPPPEIYGQMGPFRCSVSAVGVVTTQVVTNDNDGNVTFPTNYGRVAVFAFCTRSTTPATLTLANAFAEIPSVNFVPGHALRASSVLQLKKNIEESLLTPEFFGPTVYADNATIPVPTSAVDGYVYSRSELIYIWSWTDTLNISPNGGRLPVFYGSVNQTTGFVDLYVWRLGSHYDDLDNSLCRITVITVGRRGGWPASPLVSTATAPSDATTSTLPPGADVDAYAITFDMGGGRTTGPATTESLLRHYIPGNLSTVSLPSGLTASAGGCRTAPAAAYSITINKNGSSIGSINFALGATTATFTFAGAVTLVPGDLVEFVGGTADTAIKGIYFTITGLRNQ
jgi:hypothetical protein